MNNAEKDALLLEQAAVIKRLATGIAELDAILGKPRKNSSNSHTPPSQDDPGRANAGDLHGIADHVSRALLSARAFRHCQPFPKVT